VEVRQLLLTGVRLPTQGLSDGRSDPHLGGGKVCVEQLQPSLGLMLGLGLGLGLTLNSSFIICLFLFQRVDGRDQPAAAYLLRRDRDRGAVPRALCATPSPPHAPPASASPSPPPRARGGGVVSWCRLFGGWWCRGLALTPLADQHHDS